MALPLPGSLFSATRVLTVVPYWSAMRVSVSPFFTLYAPKPGDPAVITAAVSTGTAMPLSSRPTFRMQSISPCNRHSTVSADTDVTTGVYGVLVTPVTQCLQFKAELHDCGSQAVPLLRATCGRYCPDSANLLRRKGFPSSGRTP